MIPALKSINSRCGARRRIPISAIGSPSRRGGIGVSDTKTPTRRVCPIHSIRFTLACVGPLSTGQGNPDLERGDGHAEQFCIRDIDHQLAIEPGIEHCNDIISVCSKPNTHQRPELVIYTAEEICQ